MKDLDKLINDAIKGDKSQRNDKPSEKAEKEKKAPTTGKPKAKKKTTVHKSKQAKKNEFLLADAKKLVKARSFAFRPLEGLPDMFTGLPILPDLFNFYEEYQLDSDDTITREQAIRLNLSNIRKTSVFPPQAQQFLNGHPVPFDLPVYMRQAIQIIIESFKNPKTRNTYSSLKELHTILVGEDFDDGADNSYSLGLSSIVITITEGLFKPDNGLKQHILDEIGKDDPAMRTLLESGTLTPETAENISQTSLIYPGNYATLMNLGVGSIVKEFMEQQDMKKIGQEMYNKNLRNWSDGQIIGTLKYMTSPARLISFKVHDTIFK